MRLLVPGLPYPEQRDLPAGELASGFWASPWGIQDRPGNLVALVVSYLTANRALGGLEASWDDPAGLRAVCDHIIRTRPEGTSCHL